MTSGTNNHIKAYRVLACAFFDNKCRSCGSEEKLQVHHKDGACSNNDIGNLILLCSMCHGSEHARLRKEKVIVGNETPVTCHKCKHAWIYKGIDSLVTCNGCGAKVKIKSIPYPLIVKK